MGGGLLVFLKLASIKSNILHRTSWYFQNMTWCHSHFLNLSNIHHLKKNKENISFRIYFWKEKWLKRNIWCDKWNEVTARVQNTRRKNKKKIKMLFKIIFFSNKNRNNFFFHLQVRPYHKVCWKIKPRHFSFTMNINLYNFNFCIIWNT